MKALMRVSMVKGTGDDGVVPASKALLVYISGNCYQLFFPAVRLYNLLAKRVVNTFYRPWGMLNLLQDTVGFYVNLAEYPEDRRTFAVPRDDLKAACFPHARRFYMWLYGIITGVCFAPILILFPLEDSPLLGIPVIIGIVSLALFLHWRDRKD